MEGKITYQKFLDAYREANSDLKKDTQYKNGQARWNDLKGDSERIVDVKSEIKQKEKSVVECMGWIFVIVEESESRSSFFERYIKWRRKV